jgi:hypothetical protein
MVQNKGRVLFHDRLRGADRHNLTLPHENNPMTQICNRAKVMRNQKKRRPVRQNLLNLCGALLLEKDIADAKDFVDDEYFRFQENEH